MRNNIFLLISVFLVVLFTQTCTKLEDETEQPQRDNTYELVNLPTDNVEKITVIDTVKYKGRDFPVYDITIVGSEEELDKIKPGEVIYVHKEGVGGKVILVTEIKSNTKSASQLKGGFAMIILGIQATLDLYFGDEKKELLFATTDNRSRKNTKIENKVLGAAPYSISDTDFKFEIKATDSLSVEVSSTPSKLFQSKLTGTLWESADGESSIKLNGSLSIHPAFDLSLKYDPKLVEEGSSTYSSVLGWLEAAAVPDLVMAQYRDKDYFLGDMQQLRTNFYADVDFNLSYVVTLAKKFELKPKPTIPFARLITITPSGLTSYTDAAFELDLSVLAAGEFEISGDITNDLVVGVNMDKALANAVWYYDYNNSAKGGAKLKGKIELTAGISIVLDTEVYALGLLGPHIKTGPFIETKATANAVYDMNDGLAYDWKFAIDYGVKAEASLDVSLFHLDAVSVPVYKMEMVLDKSNLYSAPDSVKVVSGNEQEGTEGEKLKVPIKVGVYDSNKSLITSLPVPVYFETEDGSVNSEGPIFTDEDGYASTEWTLGLGKEDQTMTAFRKEAGVKKSEIEITAKAEKDKFLAELLEDARMKFGCHIYLDFSKSATIECWSISNKWQYPKIYWLSSNTRTAPSGIGLLNGTSLTGAQDKYDEVENESGTGNHKAVFDNTFQNLLSLEASFTRLQHKTNGNVNTYKMTIKAQDIPYVGFSTFMGAEGTMQGRAYAVYGEDIKNKITMTYEISYGDKPGCNVTCGIGDVTSEHDVSFIFGKVYD